MELAVINNENNIVEGINLDKNMDFCLEKKDLIKIILSYLKEINIGENTAGSMIDGDTIYGIGLYDVLKLKCKKFIKDKD